MPVSELYLGRDQGRPTARGQREIQPHVYRQKHSRHIFVRDGDGHS